MHIYFDISYFVWSLLWLLPCQKPTEGQSSLQPPPIWALWQCGKIQSSPQWRHMKTHLAFAKKHPQATSGKIFWSDKPQFKASCLKETSSAHHLQSTIPKVKWAGNNLMLWGCFSVTGTEGLIRVEKKLSAPKYWDSIDDSDSQTRQKVHLPTGQQP